MIKQIEETEWIVCEQGITQLMYAIYHWMIQMCVGETGESVMRREEEKIVLLAEVNSSTQ